MAPGSPRSPRPRARSVPRLPLALLRAWLPYAERDEVLAELTEEYAVREQEGGATAARAWVWRQVLGSLPPLVRRTFSRGWTGFEPASSRLRPGGPRMESWIMDLRYAARRLRSRPLYALLAILTLAIGVGGTAAAFGLVRGLMLSPLPFPEEQRLVTFWFPYSWSEREFLTLSPDWPAFEGVAAYTMRDLPLRRSADQPPELVKSLRTSAGLFDVLGVKPHLGRTFAPGDDQPGRPRQVVLSYGVFKKLGGDAGLVGSTVEIDGTPQTVIGVMPEDFWFPDPSVRAWAIEPLNQEDGAGNYTLVGRVAPGANQAAVDVGLANIAARLKEGFSYPAAWDKTREPKVTPVREEVLGKLRVPLFATLAAMAVLLIIACANVAALMLGQMDSRAVELGVRMALGADSRRMSQQLIAESLMIGLASAVVGAGIALWGHGVLTDALPLGPLAPEGQLDWVAFAACLAIAFGAALAVAWLPVRALKKADPQRALAGSRTGGIGARGGKVEGGLVIGQVALAVLLTVAAALLVRSVQNLRAIDPGVDVERAAAMDAVMETTVSADEKLRTIVTVEEALRNLPGVESVGATLHLPLRGSSQNWGMRIESKPDLASFTTATRLVTPRYFEALGIRLLEGRLLTPDDRADTEKVVLINRALAEKYFPGEHPVGQRIVMGDPWRIVGVVEDVAEAALTDEAVPARYMAYAQLPEMVGNKTTLVIRARPGVAPATLLADAQRRVQDTSKRVALTEVTTLQEVFDDSMGPARQVMAVVTLLTVLAVMLGAVGVYGVTNHWVRRRQRDLGIKVALGMSPGRVVREVITRSSKLCLAGGIVGALAAILGGQLLSAVLYGVSAIDPLSLIGSAGALLIIGVLAALLPAWRASRLDPAAVFRQA